MDNFIKHRKASSFFAFILSFYPGIGLMYLGAMKRGFQLTIIASVSLTLQHYSDIFILFFLLSMVYSVFDTLEKMRTLREGNSIKDEQIFTIIFTGNMRNVIGISLIALGLLSFMRQILFTFFNDIHYYIYDAVRGFIGGFILIGIGIAIIKYMKIPLFIKTSKDKETPEDEEKVNTEMRDQL